jgi:tetratricopeptide (TPR) repeat protein
MRYESDGSGSREVRSRIRIQSPAGLALGGQLVFEYTAFDEQVEIRSIRVLKPDGATITVGPDAVQDLSAPVAREAPMYTDARQKHVTVPGLSVGDTVEYDVITTSKPLLANQFWQIWDFEQSRIALDEQLDLNVPADRALKIKTSEKIEASSRLEGDRRLYHWATSNLKTPPPVDVFKDFHFDVVKLLEGDRPAPAPRVMFSTFQNWAEIADWYAQLERDRRVPTPEVRAQADELARGKTSDRAKAEAIYYWVSQNIRYVSLSFGVGRYQPHTAGEVFNNRYGDCKDKTTLLEAMLEAEGLRARPVLANLRQGIDVDEPNPLQFDHVVAFLKLGDKDVWLDPTIGVAPFGYLVPQLRGQDVLAVGAAGPQNLQKTPQDIPMEVEYHVTVDGDVDVEGKLNATVGLQTRGDLEVLIRILNNFLSPDQLAKTAGEIVNRSNKLFYGSTQYLGFKVLNPTDLSQPVQVQFQVAGSPLSVKKVQTRSQLTAALTDMPIAQFHLISLLPEIAYKGVGQDNSKPSAVDLKGPRSYSFTVNLAFASFIDSPTPPPNNLHIDTRFAEYESSDQWSKNTFQGKRSLTLRVPTVSPDEEKEYASFVTQVVNDASAHLTADKGATPNSVASGAPSNKTSVPVAAAMEPFNKGKEEASRKNWANAVASFTSAVTSDPNYADAWRELGRAHMYMRQYSDAESAFRKYLQLAPDDSRAYLNMAWVLYAEEKYQEDVDLMVKRIESAPQDGDALARLGAAYLALKQPEKAVPVLERATDRFPKYALAHFNLGRAYLATHQDDKAVAAFRAGLALDGSDSRLNSAAYELAEANSSLDLAESWSRQSVATVESELNASTLTNVGARTWPFVIRLGNYWDTLGWIKFRQGKVDEARKYIFAAWQLSEDPTVALHLGEISESQGQKEQALQFYLAGLAANPPNQARSEDAKDIRRRLADLLGGDSVDDRLQQYRKTSNNFRTVSVPNSAGVQGIAQYTVIIGEESGILEIAPTIPSDQFASLDDVIHKLSLPQSFPDTSIKKLPRLATLVCSAANQPCVFTLLPSATMSRVASAD